MFLLLHRSLEKRPKRQHEQLWDNHPGSPGSYRASLLTQTESSRDGIIEHRGPAKAGKQTQALPSMPQLGPSSSLSSLPSEAVPPAFPPLLWAIPFSSSLSLPIFSNFVHIDDVVSLSYGNFSGIRRKRHALHHVALSAVLRIKKRRKRGMRISERERRGKGAGVTAMSLRGLH